MAKNTICVWYDKDAEAAARFYAATFPDSSVGTIWRAPERLPIRQRRAMCWSSNSRLPASPASASTAVPSSSTAKRSRSYRHRRSSRDRPLLERHRRQWRPRERVRLVQGQVGRVVADHAARADRSDGGRRRSSQARVRGDDDDAEDRRRRDRGGAARLSFAAGGRPPAAAIRVSISGRKRLRPYRLAAADGSRPDNVNG